MTTPILTKNVQTHWFCYKNCEPVTIPIDQLADIGTPICADCETPMTMGDHVDIATGDGSLSQTFVKNHDHLDLEALESRAHSISSDLLQAKNAGDKNAIAWLRNYGEDLDHLIALRQNIQHDQQRLAQRDTTV